MNLVRRTDVVGSLLRPEYLKEATGKKLSGQLGNPDYKRVEDRAVDAAIALQESLGYDLVTDGETRRMVFLEQFISGINGTDLIAAPAVSLRDAEGNVEDFTSPLSIVDKISRKKFVSIEEYVYSRAKASTPVKVTLPSPFLMWVMWSPEHSPAAYPDPFDLFVAGAELIREEVLALAELGCRHIQIDAPEILQVTADPVMRRTLADLGLPVDRIVAEGSDLINSMVRGIEGIEFSLHMCRANFKSKWLSEGGYDEVVRDVVPKLHSFGRVLLEYDDERAGTFAPLAQIPADKEVVLGLVSSKRDEVEDDQEVERSVRRAAQYIDLDRLALSTQCGFASDATGNLVSYEHQERKLRLVTQVAERIWSD